MNQSLFSTLQGVRDTIKGLKPKSLADQAVKNVDKVLYSLSGTYAIDVNGNLQPIPTSLPQAILEHLQQPLRNNPDPSAGEARFYESLIDDPTNGVLSFFYPTILGFRVAPQFTYNTEVSNPLTDEYSTHADAGDASWIELGGFLDDSEPVFNPEDQAQAHSTPPNDHPWPQSSKTNPAPIYRELNIKAVRELPAFIPNLALDSLGRTVDSTPGRLKSKRPDFIVAKGLKTLIIVENKITSKMPAIRQLKGYMTDLRTSNPSAIGMACIGGQLGLEIAFMKWNEGLEIVPLEYGPNGKPKWFPVKDPRVFQTFVRILVENVEVVALN
ncbi:hypothetical protein BT96DRAFT_982371 [Gymnopus androsaceus JB14]|uniref:Uncharacterized protein n=1 Tax=Gymnopus androsaceus JB14 TaxID=1447944 RepID=A0A6A4GFI7_9AGAR|nr:hypothetical protein BT96DRAFT_982371 [Gymnopus androsaceus JB14]